MRAKYDNRNATIKQVHDSSTYTRFGAVQLCQGKSVIQSSINVLLSIEITCLSDVSKNLAWPSVR